MYVLIKTASKASSILNLKHEVRQAINQAQIQKDDVACHNL